MSVYSGLQGAIKGSNGYKHNIPNIYSLTLIFMLEQVTAETKIHVEERRQAANRI